MSGPISARDKHKEAKREIGLRQHVYPRFVETGKITAKEAARRIAIMEAIALDYESLAKREEEKWSLL